MENKKEFKYNEFYIIKGNYLIDDIIKHEDLNLWSARLLLRTNKNNRILFDKEADILGSVHGGGLMFVKIENAMAIYDADKIDLDKIDVNTDIVEFLKLNR